MSTTPPISLPPAVLQSWVDTGGPGAPPPLAVYVHLPWCVRKCPYCDFNSHAWRGDDLPEQEYLQALERDLVAALPEVWGRPVTSVFIGGGTPSLFSGQGIEHLLTLLRTLLPVLPQAEITLEANPGTVEATRFRDYRAAGVNRLSLGVQSFNPAHLAALGRIHDDRAARAAVEAALSTFDSVNLDLMYALPDQTLVQARRDMETAMGYEPRHLSAYHLTLEPNTPFAAAPPALPDDDLAADMQEMVESTLASGGYQHYETSAFARPGHQCQHNLNYWLFGDYLGLGAGAHSKLSLPGQIQRQSRVRHPRDYLASAGTPAAIATRHTLTREDRLFEFMMNALRLTDGYDPRLFPERTGLPPTAAEPALDRAQAAGLLVRDERRVAPTERGRRFLNDLLQFFLGDNDRSHT